MPSRERPRESIDDLDALLGALPPEIVEAVHGLPDRSALIEVVMDLGRRPEGRFPDAEVSLLDEFLGNPMALAGLGGVILLLVGYGAYAWRKKKATQSRFQDSVLGAASGGSSVFNTAGATSASAAAPRR